MTTGDPDGPDQDFSEQPNPAEELAALRAAISVFDAAADPLFVLESADSFVGRMKHPAEKDLQVEVSRGQAGGLRGRRRFRRHLLWRTTRRHR